jgi:DNA-binding NarL/FixJ family response regulator
MERTTILLVDDEPTVRRGLRMRLDLEPDFLVIGEAGDGEAALASALVLAPSVVVMDVEMPRMDGIAATRELRERLPSASVVVLSMHDDADTKGRAAEAGAVAFIAKHSNDEALLDAIRRAARSAEGVP